jgi:hypothetical protein
MINQRENNLPFAFFEALLKNQGITIAKKQLGFGLYPHKFDVFRVEFSIYFFS